MERIWFRRESQSLILGEAFIASPCTPELYDGFLDHWWYERIYGAVQGGAINCTDFVLKYDICLVGEKCCYSAQMIP